jgi:hypothetical protein
MLIKPRQLLKLNLKFYLDQVLVREGSYQNVSLGQIAFDNTDVSELKPDNSDITLAMMGLNREQAFRVYQSPFRNWVYESGLLNAVDRGEAQKNAPILASGVYVNGIFKTDNAAHLSYDPTLVPTIDWLNGRVILSSGLGASDTVRADYSYLEVAVDFADRHNVDMEEYVQNTKYGTNPDTFGSIAYPSGRFKPLPAVFIEITEQTHEPYELGNRSLAERDLITFHVFSFSQTMFDNIMDTIRLQDRRPFPIVDYNVAPMPLSGFLGARSPEYNRYGVMQSNVVLHPSGYSTLYGLGYFENGRAQIDNVGAIEAGRVFLDVLTYVMVSDGPFGTSSIGFNFFENAPA